MKVFFIDKTDDKHFDKYWDFTDNGLSPSDEVLDYIDKYEEWVNKNLVDPTDITYEISYNHRRRLEDVPFKIPETDDTRIP